MSNAPCALEPALTSRPSRILSLLATPKTRLIFLQSLVSIILSYELLLSTMSLVSLEVGESLTLGLWLLTLGLCAVPARLFEGPWLVGTLLVFDTIFTATAIYLSGNATTPLYVAFFLLILVAASVRSLTLMLSLSLLLCAGYGALLYQGILVSGTLSVGHLLGIPVLLVMAVFYGLILETLAGEREKNVALVERVNALRWEEAQLLQSRQELELRVGQLKEHLGVATQEIQIGRLERQGLETRLQQAQKMEAVGRLAGVIGRDFNNLLRAIGGQSGELLKKLQPQDALRQHVHRILQAGDRAAVLTGQLQMFSHQHSFQLEALPLNLTVEELQRLLRGLLPKNVELRLMLDPAVGGVRADRGQLELAIMNLVVNARDAMPRGGQLTIETRKASHEEVVFCEAEGAQGGQYVAVAISDTGCGMTAETEARLFEPFFSTKEHASGIGLATVYGIIKQCGGHILVDSDPGRGTTCTVYLQTVGQSVSHSRGAPRPDQELQGTETVLLVDEEEVFRKLSFATLQRHDYQVLEARTPVEALLVAQRFTGPIHVMVSNAIMPDINGRELTDRLVIQHPALRSVYLGGYTDEIILRQRIKGTGFLQRPCSQRDLVHKVREVLDGH